MEGNGLIPRSSRNLQEPPGLTFCSFWPQREEKTLPSPVKGLCPFLPKTSLCFGRAPRPRGCGLSSRPQSCRSKCPGVRCCPVR